MSEPRGRLSHVARACLATALSLTLLSGCTIYRSFDTFPLEDLVTEGDGPPSKKVHYTAKEITVSTTGSERLSSVEWEDDDADKLGSFVLQGFKAHEWPGTYVTKAEEADYLVTVDIDEKETVSYGTGGFVGWLLSVMVGMGGGIGIGYSVGDTTGFAIGAVIGELAGIFGGILWLNKTSDVDLTTTITFEDKQGQPFFDYTTFTSKEKEYWGYSIFASEKTMSKHVNDTVEAHVVDTFQKLQAQAPLKLADHFGAMPTMGTAVATAPLVAPKVPTGDPTKVFVMDFTFKLTTPGWKTRDTTVLSQILATELQSALQSKGRFSALTTENLQDQLAKEKQKELLQCTGSSCVQKIVDNFGLSDTISGVVKQLNDETFHVVLTYFRDEEIVNTVADTCPATDEALLGLMATLGDALVEDVQPPD